MPEPINNPNPAPNPEPAPEKTFTQAEADRLLVQDCQGAANAVDSPKYCPLTGKLNDNQRDALISFTFNCGAGNLRTLCRGRTLEQVCGAMALYNKGNGGQVLPGLVRRRRAEQELFHTPVAPAESEEPMTNEIRYDALWEVPDWARPTVEKLVKRGHLNGDGNGLDLSYDMTRILVILDRAGAFD